MLFVPGDSEKKFLTASAGNADALILDLEDAVAPARKADARALVAELVERERSGKWRLFVRVNSLDTRLILDDLAAAVRPGLDGILVPKANGAHDIAQIGYYLEALEARAGMTPGTVKIAVVSTETPAAMFALGSYAPAHPRLVALTWGAEDLAAAIGATANKNAGGEWTLPYQLARAQCLFAASAAGVAPLDTLFADYRDTEGLETDCLRSRRDGFTGRIAIHPDQIDTINRCYSPSIEDIAHASRVVAAFAAAPDAGTIGIDGKMYDIPHLKNAERTLAAADEAES